MRVTAKADYAVRATVELAQDFQGYRRVESIAQAQNIPTKFLQTILSDLRRGGVVISRRGVDGGYRLARPAHTISVADVLQVTDGPLTIVRGAAGPEPSQTDPPSPSGELWAALWASMQEVLQNVTLADLLVNHIPLPHIPLPADASTDCPSPRRYSPAASSGAATVLASMLDTLAPVPRSPRT